MSQDVENFDQLSVEDQLAALAQELLYGEIVPEWSMSKQEFQPVDIGTISSNIDYVNDLAYNAQDPFFSILMGGELGPEAFEPVKVDIARPDVTVYDSMRMQAETGESAIRAMYVALLDQGFLPLVAARQAVLAAPEEAGLTNLADEQLDEAVDKIAESMIGDGEKYLSEAAALAQWEEKPFYTEESEAAKQFREAGVPLPTERFAPSDFFDPQEDAAAATAARVMERYDSDMAKVAEMKADFARKVAKGKVESGNVGPGWGVDWQDASAEVEAERAVDKRVAEHPLSEWAEAPPSGTDLFQSNIQSALREEAEDWVARARDRAPTAGSEGAEDRVHGQTREPTFEGHSEWAADKPSAPNRWQERQNIVTAQRQAASRVYQDAPTAPRSGRHTYVGKGSRAWDRKARAAAQAAARVGYTPTLVALKSRFGQF